jgi:hypothetical protein
VPNQLLQFIDVIRAKIWQTPHHLKDRWHRPGLKVWVQGLHRDANSLPVLKRNIWCAP